MSKIAIMDMGLANLIAAGEVVERPASVVKELVENAIDANATSIIIEINNMGLEYIKITDNGFGMEQSDLLVAHFRHATSKIFKTSDLNNIETLGFRGEALAAISSVAKMELHSKTKDSLGHFIKLENNKIIEQGSIAMNVGTTVIVKELFYNTPARFKYMKSEYAEKNAIIEVFEKISLSNPNIAFQLIIDDKEYKSTIGNGNILQLIDSIYGKNTIEGIKTLKTSIGKINVDCYLINPKFVRSKRNDINIFINKRYIKNYSISQSIIDGYQTYLMQNKFPIALCYLSLDPNLVDVNVHPQKMEVKLANELMFAYALTPLIKEALNKGSLPIRETIKEVKKEVFKPEYFDIFSMAVQEEEKVFLEETIEFENSNIKEFEEKLPELDYIGTLLGTYLLFQNETGLFLMDQHAAAERIRYEYYETKVGELKSDSYELIVPKNLYITNEDIKVIQEHKTILKELGFVIEKDQLLSHPTWLRDKEIDLAILGILDQINKNNTISLKDLRNQLAKDLACKGAIKANHQLSIIEIDKLIKDLRGCKNPYTCPHGRPVLIKLSEYDIEKMFKRIV